MATLTQPGPLTGYTVGVTAARRREELTALLARRGAEVVEAPVLRILPLADDLALREATDRCLAAPLDYVVATTGVGWRGWMSAAEGWGRGAALAQACRGAVVLSRGPKATGAVRASGLDEGWSPPPRPPTNCSPGCSPARWPGGGSPSRSTGSGWTPSRWRCANGEPR